MIKHLPSQAQLLQYFHYDVAAGKIFWLPRGDDARSFNGKLAWKEAGTVLSCGYRVIKLNGTPYYAHRIVWKIITGNDVIDCIDHIDGDRLNNKFENLREATPSQNAWNARLRSNSYSGFKGASFNKKLGKWVSRIRVDGKEKYLGLFESAEQAHAAFAKEAMIRRNEFARVA